jgi:peptide/nickel transport system substrate-binding protein
VKNHKKWLIPVATLSMAGMLLAGCGSGSTATNNASSGSPGQPKDGGTLTISTFSDIVNVNPIYVSDTSSGDIDNFIYANLYNLDAKGNLVADAAALAAEPLKISDDGKTYTIKLKDTPKWTDGKPVTADDVVFTLNALRNPKYNSPSISSYDKIQDVKKVDEHTVRVTLKHVYAPFQYALAIPVVPYHVLKDVNPADLKKNPYGMDPAKTVSDGPWKWTEWKQKEYLKFEANPDYWGPKPHIKEIVYKVYADQNTEVQALLKGDSDLSEAIPVTQLEVVKRNPNMNVLLQPGPMYEFVAFNFKDSNFPDNWSPFHGVKTRQAIAYAINRDGIIKNILKGTGRPVNSPFLPGTWADPGDAATNYTYDPNKAKQLLAEDGWKPGPDGILVKDGHRFSFELQFNTGNNRREQVAAVIQQNLRDVGIEVKPKAIDFSSWVDQNLNPGKFEAVLLSWQMNNPDPDQETSFSSKYFPPNGQNMGWYKNPELDKLWVEGYSTTDQSKRKEIYKQAAQVISNDLPYVFLYQYGLPEAVNKRVHWKPEDQPQLGLPFGYFFHLQYWWVDAK